MDMEVQRLSQLARAHQNEQYQIRQSLRHISDTELPMLEKRLTRQSADIATIEANGGIEQPALILNGQTITNPKAAQERLRTTIESQWERLAFTLEHAPTDTQERVTIGTFGGLEIQLTLEKTTRMSGSISLKGESRTARNLRGPGSDRLLAYLHELSEALPQKAQEMEEERETIQTKMEGLQNRLGLPFEHEAALSELTEMRSELQSLLQSDTSVPSSIESSESSEPENEATSEDTRTVQSQDVNQEQVTALIDKFDAMSSGECATATPGCTLHLSDLQPVKIKSQNQRATTVRPQPALSQVTYQTR